MRRRDFLKVLGVGAAAAARPEMLLGKPAAGKKQPNVVLIFTDDQGSVDLNCYGAKDLYTPNLDALARRGTRFGQFYVGSPVCSPSRAALLTGRYPHRAGMASNAGRTGMPASQVTIAEMLKGAGYRTALFGKWHLGEVKEMSPPAQGFDEFFGHKVGCIDNYSHFFYWSGPNRHDLWRGDTEVWESGKYFPDLIVREAGRFLEANKARPFFMYLPFNVPHYPLQGDDDLRQRYAKMKMDPKRRRYAAFTSSLDRRIGQVIDKIDSLGLRDNTLIIFLSDHGHSEEERTFGGGGSAGPYRGHKFTVWEGGIRVPAIVSWPGKIPENAVRDQMVISMDWLPTIAHYCGVKLPDRKIDGRNIAPVIASAKAPSPHKVLHWMLGNQWAVRDGKWKLVANPWRQRRRGARAPKPIGKYFLSDMDADVTETKNLADKNPDVVKRLTKLHEAWVKEVKQQ